jgi:hypothetical protein
MTTNKQKPGAAATASGSLVLQNPCEGLSTMTIMIPPPHDKRETQMPEVLVLDATRYPLLTKHWPGIIGGNGGQSK